MVLRSLTCWLVCAFCSVTCAQLRVVTWNTNGGARDGTADVLEAIGLEVRNGFAKPIDVLSLQEQNTQDTASIVAALNGRYGAGVYQAAPQPANALSSGAGLPALIYNSQTVDLLESIAFGVVNTSAQARSTLRYKIIPEGYGDDASFYLYSNHYKASQGGSNEARRNVEATALRANLDALGQGTSAVLSGDFNIYRSSEPSYLTLTSSGAGQAFDPIDTPGNWHDNSAYRIVHTQSPSTSSLFPGQVTGGMDDRFDFQLVTDELLDGEGLDYLSGSYRTFGNNGTHNLNGDITSGSGAAAPVLAALRKASDHLPVVADYQVPAAISAGLVNLLPLTPVELGTPLSYGWQVWNSADVMTPTGADELDYLLQVSGDTPAAGDYLGSDAALGGRDEFDFLLDTSSTGEKSISLALDALSPGTRLGDPEGGSASTLFHTATWTVYFPGDFNDDGIVDASDYVVWRDNVGEPIGALANDPTPPLAGLTIGQGHYNTWRQNYGRSIADFLASTTIAVPEPAATHLVLAVLVTLWPRRRAGHPELGRRAELGAVEV